MVGKLGGTGKYSSEEKGNNLWNEIGWGMSSSAGLKTFFLFSYYSILNLLSCWRSFQPAKTAHRALMCMSVLMQAITGIQLSELSWPLHCSYMLFSPYLHIFDHSDSKKSWQIALQQSFSTLAHRGEKYLL